MELPSLNCPNLTSLELDGYAHMLSTIPSILSALPSLIALTVKWVNEDIKDMVFEHDTIWCRTDRYRFVDRVCEKTGV